MATKRRAASSRPALTFAEVKSRIQRPHRVCELVMDGQAAAEVEELGVLLERLKARDEILGGPAQAPAVAKELQRAEVRADESRVAFTLRAIAHTRYQELIAKHPAAADQKARQQAEGGEVWPFDPDTFAPELVREQLLDPAPGPEDDFDEFWSELSDGQMRQLWLTALGVQMQATTVGPRSQAAAEVLRAASES